MALKTQSARGSSGFHADEETDAPIVAEINITPLTDVFLVLLIIFMVTSSVMSQLGVEVKLPKASQSVSSSQPEGVIVTLLAGGGVKLQGREISADRLSEMTPLLVQALAQTATKLVVLEGDRQAMLGSAVQVMDLAKKAGAEKFAIATQEGSGI